MHREGLKMGKSISSSSLVSPYIVTELIIEMCGVQYWLWEEDLVPSLCVLIVFTIDPGARQHSKQLHLSRTRPNLWRCYLPVRDAMRLWYLLLLIVDGLWQESVIPSCSSCARLTLPCKI